MPCLLVISGFQQHTVTRAHLIIIQEEFQGIKPHLPIALASPRSVHKAVSGRHTDILRCLLFLSLPHTLLEASSSCRNCPLSSFAQFWRAETCSDCAAHSDHPAGGFQPASAVDSFPQAISGGSQHVIRQRWNNTGQNGGGSSEPSS